MIGSIDTSKVVDKYNEQPFRIRIIFLVLIVAFMVFIMDFVFLQPATESQAKRLQEVALWDGERLAMSQALSTQQAQRMEYEAQSEKIKELNIKTQELKKEILEIASKIAPTNIMEAARTLLSNYPSIIIHEISLDTPQAVKIGKDPIIINGTEHVVTVRVEGAYLDLLRYVRALETQLMGANWKSIHITQVPERGVNILKLELSQLTFDTRNLENL